MSVELHIKHASPVSGFMNVQNCAFLGINLHFILVSPQEKGTTLLFQ